MPLPLFELSIVCLIVFGAGIVRGYSGFALSALVVAAASLVVDAKLVVILALLLEVAASILHLPAVRKDVDWKLTGLLLAGAALGTPLGIYLLSDLPEAPLKIGIAGFVLLASIGLMSIKGAVIAPSQKKTFGCGIFAGVVNGATAMGGLPVALYLLASAQRAQVSRATFVAFFLVLDTGALLVALAFDLITLSTLLVAAISLPALAAGLWVGHKGFAFASPDAFRRFALILLILLGVSGIARLILNI